MSTEDIAAKNLLRPLIIQEFARHEANGDKVDTKTGKKRRMKILLSILVILAVLALLGRVHILVKFAGCWVGIFLLIPLFVKLFEKRENVILGMAQKEPDTPITQIVEREVCPISGFGKIRERLVAGVMTVVMLLVPSVDPDAATAENRPGLARGESTVVQEYEDGWIIVAASQGLTQREEITLGGLYEGKPIRAIGADAFAGLTKLRRIELPDTVKFIDKRAFEGCTKLEEILLPEGLETVEGGAFRNCDSLVSFTFPSTVTHIGGECFQYCDRLEEVNLPQGIVEIRGNTFEGCKSLRSIHIPEGVTRIAAHAFRDCSRLAQVTVPSTVKEIGSSAFRDCDSLKEITIPKGASVNERAFKGSPTKITYQ